MKNVRFPQRCFAAAAALVLATICPLQIMADSPLKEQSQQSSNLNFEYGGSADNYYSDLLKTYDEYGYRIYNGKPISFGIDEATYANKPLTVAQTEGRTSFAWGEDVDYIEYSITVETAALYGMEMDYLMPKDSKEAAVRMLYVDGQVPFYEANTIHFQCAWKDAAEPAYNSLGDQTWPSQELLSKWTTNCLSDSSGYYDESFRINLSAGKHTIRLEYISDDMVVSDFRLVAPASPASYDTVSASYKASGYMDASSETLLFQAEENVKEKSESSVRREADNDPLTTPYTVSTRSLNIIGGERWNSGGQSVTFSFTVAESGLYKLGFRILQKYNNGMPSYRKIAVDGEVPFLELNAYAFDYSRKWQTVTLSDDKALPYLFYLEAGPHTLTLTATVSPILDVIHSLNEDTLAISGILQDIYAITTANPDANYDYKLFKTIPNLEERFNTLIKSMQFKYDRLSAICDKLPAIANNFLTITEQLQEMIDDPYRIPRKLGDLENSLTNLGTWYQDIQGTGLAIDRFQAAGQSTIWTQQNSSFFIRAWGSIVNFALSFVKDYDNVGSMLENDVPITQTLDVWVAYGTEWVEQLQELCDTTFTKTTGIQVRMNVLPSGQLNTGSANVLMLSITSGKAPDVALGVTYNSPVEFAIRDAVVDLSKYEDFDEVSSQFLDAIFTPLNYQGGIYALPENMNFTVMYYRKDILSKYGISLPNTWGDLYNNTLPLLYQNNLEFYCPVDYSLFLYQNRGNYYTDDGYYSALDTPEAYQALKQLTELYTNYGVPVTADFYNRFRSGEMPLGISNYNLYLLFSTAAPELAGKWGITAMPGIEQEDGTIDRSSGGLVGNVCMIMEQSKKQEAAWQFLKWWTSSSIQKDFASNIESLIGADARWASANISAFKSLSWNKGDLAVIQDYWKWAREQPVVLGGYYTSRHINNAWNRIINDGQSVRDSLTTAVYDINRELRAKQEEYGIYAN